MILLIVKQISYVCIYIYIYQDIKHIVRHNVQQLTDIVFYIPRCYYILTLAGKLNIKADTSKQMVKY